MLPCQCKPANRGERGTQQVPNDKHRNTFPGISRIMSLQDLLSSNIVAASPGLHVVGDSLLYKLEGSVVFNTLVRRGGGLPQESKGEQGRARDCKFSKDKELYKLYTGCQSA